MTRDDWIGYLDRHAGAFLAAFWPNFAATAIGVALGIPVALWLYNHGARAARAQAQRADRLRLAQTVQVLLQVLREHATELDRAAQRAETSVETVTELRTAVWEAVRQDAFRLIPEPKLRGDLASHFERVERLNAAHAMRTQRILARLGQGLFSDPTAAEESIHKTLRDMATEAASTARALETALAAVPLPDPA